MINYFNPPINLVCIDISDYIGHLTKGKVYEISYEMFVHYSLIDDYGQHHTFPIKLFTTIEEWRNLQLNKLNI